MVFLFMLSFFSSHSFARAINADFSYKKTSDHIHFRTQDIEYLTYRSDLTYPYADEGDSGRGYCVEAKHGSGNSQSDPFSMSVLKWRYISKKNENFNWSVSEGLHTLKNEEAGGPSATLMSINLNSQWQFSKLQFLQLQFNHDWKYTDLSLPGSLDQFLKSDRLDIFFFLRPHHRTRVIAPVTIEEISDNNRKFQFNPQVLYGVLPDTPWLWVGLGAEYLSNRNPGVGYWSPSKFIAFGPRFEFATPFGSSDWSLNSAFALNRLKEENNSFGRGVSSSVSIQKGARDQTHVGVSYYKISSEQSGSDWHEVGAKLNIFYLF